MPRLRPLPDGGLRGHRRQPRRCAVPLGLAGDGRARRLGTLHERLVAPGTLARYRHAVRRLLDHWRREEVRIRVLASVDAPLAAYIEELWAEGEPLNLANDTVSGLQHFLPAVRGHTRQAWRLTKAWARAEPPSRAAPASPQFALAVAGCCRALGELGAAAMILCGFDAFLRTGELMSIVPEDVVVYSRRQRAVLRLVHTKTSVRKNALESVVIRSALAVQLLEAALQVAVPERPLIGLAPHRFRLLFRSILTALDLQGFNYSLYSLRRGGATWDFLRHGSMETTLLRGRWASTATARIYVQDAAAEVASLRLSEGQRACMRAAALLLSGDLQS